MRDYNIELLNRIEFIKNVLQTSGAQGIVYGNSGGKDCTLVSILCKRACDNVLGVIIPCQSSRNYGEDMNDALTAAEQYNIETITVDITSAKESLLTELDKVSPIISSADANIAPRLRMTVLYALGQSRNYLVAGTGNRSERHIGYFTKWGDGACDFNPIADLTVKEVYEFLEFLGSPANILTKEPSAGLFEGQTDESEIGLSYEEIDRYLMEGTASPVVKEKLDGLYTRSEHKRRMPVMYEG